MPLIVYAVLSLSMVPLVLVIALYVMQALMDLMHVYALLHY
jgi:hypothetical protein